jgi:hypothetical protein
VLHGGQDVYAMVRRFSGGGSFSLTAQSTSPPSPCSLGWGTTALILDVPLTANLANVAGAECRFVFTPPASTSESRLTLFPTTPADFDLYVRVGSPPTTSLWDCRPFLGGASTETCQVTHNGADVYAMVRRFSGSGDFTVVAENATPLCSLGNGTTPLAEGTPVTGNLLPVAGAACHFSFLPAASADVGRIVMAPATSDFDLYVKRGAPPTTTDWECRPFAGGTTVETCDLLVDGSTFFAMVRRFGGDGDFEIVASSVTVPELTPGVPVVGTVATGQQLLWKVVAPAGSSEVTVQMVGDAPNALFPDADLYVRHENIPTTSAFHCRPFTFGSTEQCTFNDALFNTLGTNPTPLGIVRLHPYQGDGRYFVMVRGFAGPADFGLVAAVA